MLLTRQHIRPKRLRDDTEDQCALVDDELGPPQMILLVPHVAVFELRPLELRQVQAPDDWCHAAERYL